MKNTKLKFFLCVISVSFLINALSAQVKIDQTGVLKFKITPKNILDSAYLRVYYNMNYLPDPANPLSKKHADTFLQVGKKLSRFMDYNDFRSDSLNDAAVGSGKTASEIMAVLMSSMRKAKLDEPNIIMEYPKGKVTFQQAVFLKRYQYKEDMPKFNWSLVKGDTIIKGYPCKKATCRYKGRDYIAWYTEKIDLPLGPYVFGGLPGLIFQVKDKKGQYMFSLNGIEPMKKYDPIYLRTGNIIASTRKRVRKIYKNNRLYPAKAIINSGKTIKISKKDLASIKPKPYNPIELE